MTTKFDQSIKYVTSDKGLLKPISERWSPRAFADKPVSSQQLETIFTAGSWAASSYNEQPWRFVVGVKGTPVYDKIFKALVPQNQAWAKSAPVLFASFAKKTFTKNGQKNSVCVHDVGLASANIVLQATSMNLYAHGMAGFDAAVLKSEFQVPDDFEPVACWALGHLGDPETLPDQLRAMETAKRERKSLQEVVFGEWGQPLKF